MDMLKETKTCGLRPGQIVEGKGIFIGTFDLVDAQGSRLDIKTNWYDAALDFGKPKTFKEAADTVASCDVNGRGCLRLNPLRYEGELFEKLKFRDAMGKHVIAPLAVVEAIYNLRHRGEYKRMSEDNLPGKLITIARGTAGAHWQWSCTSHRNNPGLVRCALRSWLFNYF